MISGICALLLIYASLPGLVVAVIFCAERASLVPFVVWVLVIALLAAGGMA